MYLAIVTFDLTHSPVSFAEMRDWVADKAMDDYAKQPGVHFKAWYSDEMKRLWGAVYLVDSPASLRRDKLPLLPNGHTGPVGARPTSIEWVELEALVLGPEGLAEALGSGLSVQHKQRRRRVVWTLEKAQQEADRAAAEGRPA